MRFATHDYKAEHTGKSIRNRFMHLTNYSVNKRSDDFVVNTSVDRDAEGSKWSLTALWKYLEAKGVDVPALRARIHDIAVSSSHRPQPATSPRRFALCSSLHLLLTPSLTLCSLCSARPVRDARRDL